MELDVLEEFNRRSDEVLHYLWDPIGVAGTVMARDEYTGYVPRLMPPTVQGRGQTHAIAARATRAAWESHHLLL